MCVLCFVDYSKSGQCLDKEAKVLLMHTNIIDWFMAV